MSRMGHSSRKTTHAWSLNLHLGWTPDPSVLLLSLFLSFFQRKSKKNHLKQQTNFGVIADSHRHTHTKCHLYEVIWQEHMSDTTPVQSRWNAQQLNFGEVDELVNWHINNRLSVKCPSASARPSFSKGYYFQTHARQKKRRGSFMYALSHINDCQVSCLPRAEIRRGWEGPVATSPCPVQPLYSVEANLGG